MVKKGLRITRILWIHCSLGCLSVARKFWSLSILLPVGRCMDSGFGRGCFVSLTRIGAVLSGVAYSGFSAEFRLSPVSFCYESCFRVCLLLFQLFTGTFWDKFSRRFQAKRLLVFQPGMAHGFTSWLSSLAFHAVYMDFSVDFML